MAEFVEFLTKVGPGLMKLATTLFDAFDGDHEAAQRNIEDRRQEILAMRTERDRQLDAKHRSE